mmetsp:Transcript_24779/g.98370  ORF Transcript_24779/g.98370 Transcript_24779/m.98370 type:complete len:283 (+) Transcript_24779:453-1301(+)
MTSQKTGNAVQPPSSATNQMGAANATAPTARVQSGASAAPSQYPRTYGAPTALRSSRNRARSAWWMLMSWLFEKSWTVRAKKTTFAARSVDRDLPFVVEAPQSRNQTPRKVPTKRFRARHARDTATSRSTHRCLNAQLSSTRPTTPTRLAAPSSTSAVSAPCVSSPRIAASPRSSSSSSQPRSSSPRASSAAARAAEGSRSAQRTDAAAAPSPPAGGPTPKRASVVPGGPANKMRPPSRTATRSSVQKASRGAALSVHATALARMSGVPRANARSASTTWTA